MARNLPPNRGSSPAQRESDLRLPPHDEGAERGVLGCCLRDARVRVAECQAAFHGQDVFYIPRHSLVFKTMAQMVEALEVVDVITLIVKLKDRTDHQPDEGWLAFIAQLDDGIMSAWNLPSYVAIVWADYLRRRMLWALSECSQRVMEYSGSASEVRGLLDKCEAEVLGVQRLGAGSSEARGMAVIVGEALGQIEDIRRGVGLITGIRTHFGHLDKWTAGLHRKQMLILAARPGLGKTALALGMAEQVAARERVGVGVFSMEMEDVDLIVRMLCGKAEVDGHKLRTGFASHEDMDRLPPAGLVLGKLPIWIDSTPALGILELKARARRLVNEHQVGVIVVDYLQLMHGSKDYRDNRALEVAEISGGLKALAKELNVAMVVLSQLNRETERQKNRKPQLADIRESGAIEQDADTVLMLYRPKGDDDEDGEDGQPAEVIKVNGLIAKQRHGPHDWDVEFLFHRKFTRFEDAYQNQGHLPVQAGAGESNVEGRESIAGGEGQPRGGALPTNEELGLE